MFKSITPIALTVIAGISLAVFAYFYLFDLEEKRITNDFRILGENISADIKQRLTDHVIFLEKLAATVENQGFNKKKFAKRAERFLKQNSEIKSIEYLAARQKQGNLQCTVVAGYPYSRDFTGLDRCQLTNTADTLKSIFKTQKVLATGQVNLSEINLDKGLIVTAPVKDREKVKGFTSLAFNLEQAIANALGNTQHLALQIRVTDQGEIIENYISRPAGEKKTGSLEVPRVHYLLYLNFAGRQWGIITNPLQGYQVSWQPMIFSLLLALLSIVIATVLYFKIHQNEIIEQEVKERNKEILIEHWLKNGVNALNEQIRGRQTTEELARHVLRLLAVYVEADAGVFYYLQKDHLVSQSQMNIQLEEDLVVLEKSHKIWEDINTQKPVVSEKLAEIFCHDQNSLGISVAFTNENEMRGLLVLLTKKKPGDVDLELLKMVNSTVAIALESAELYASLEEKVELRTHDLNRVLDELYQDLALARKIQHNVLPWDFSKYQGVDISILFQPMIEVGGDIFDLYEVKPGKLRGFICDATGHGIQAALNTMIIKGEYDKIKDIDFDPARVIAFLNVNYFDKYARMNGYFTCFVFDLDIEKKELSYCSGGHPEQVLMRGDEIHLLKSRGCLIGFKPDYNFETGTMKLQSGDKLLLFSDGLDEAQNRQQQLLETHRLFDIFHQYRDLGPVEFNDRVHIAVKQWQDGAEATDDMTLLTISIK